MDQNPIILKPGHENYVAISITNITSTEEIKSIDPQKRNCLFPDEMTLKVSLTIDTCDKTEQFHK